MNTLLISLGTSPAIVPEAFLLPGARFTEVHVITTETTAVDFVEEWFRLRAPEVRLTFTRVAGFRDLRSEEDHFRFEEVLYRWWLSRVAGRLPYVCLAGGFKTISSGMQKAAAVMGAAEVFHVLAEAVFEGPNGRRRPAETAGEIDQSVAGDHLHWIRLGGESGWPQCAAETASRYPLTVEREDGRVCWVSAPDDRFRQRLREVVELSHNVARAWERLAGLPFPVLATWPRAALEWLDQPLDPVQDVLWLQRLPKVELHCHLGGFATHGDTLQRVRAAAAVPAGLPQGTAPTLPTGWPHPPAPVTLDAYMALGDATGSRLLKDPGCLHRHCELLYQQLVDDGVVHAEIRCSPNNYTTPGRSSWQVLTEIRGAFEECMKRTGTACHVNLIVIATRKQSGDRSDISRHLALAVTAADQWKTGCRVVGVDLAGFEKPETRASLFATDFEPVHRVGLAVTVHAGENDDAEGIWQAVFKLNARRLGHALHLADAPDLLRAVADRGIGVEMCPFANLQIKGFGIGTDSDRPRYPLHRYLRQGVAVTVNTDNIGISAASLTDNLALAARLCPDLTRLDALRLLRHGTDQAFLSPDERTRLTARIESLLPFPHS